jgi:hypothetical protein
MEVQLPCYFCILFILRCSCHPHTPRFLDPQKDSLLQRQKRTKMGTLCSRQNIQNNMKGHEQTNYQRNNFNLRLSFQLGFPYQIRYKGLRAFFKSLFLAYEVKPYKLKTLHPSSNVKQVSKIG